MAFLGCVGLPGNEKCVVGLYLCRCCLILMQFPQIELGRLHQYLFVDQHEWLRLNLKPVHRKICRKTLRITIKIADALKSSLIFKWVLPCVKGSVSMWDEASLEGHIALGMGAHASWALGGTEAYLSSGWERFKPIRSIHSSIICVGVFSSKYWEWCCWRESPEFGLMRALRFAEALCHRVSFGV